jgi:hypothetical protein
MKYLTKVIAVTAVAISIALPAGYFAYTASNQSAPSAADFVPADAQYVMRLSLNSSSTYAFVSGGSASLVLGYNMSTFENRLSADRTAYAGNGFSGNITPVRWGEYRGYTIYRLENATFNTAALLGTLANVTGLGAFFDFSALSGSGSVYISQVAPQMVAVGGTAGINASIDAHLSGKNFARHAELLFSPTSDLSVYVNSSTTPFELAVLNIFADSGYLNLTFPTAASAQRFYSVAVNYTSNVSAVAAVRGDVVIIRFDAGLTGLGSYVYLLREIEAHL